MNQYKLAETIIQPLTRVAHVVDILQNLNLPSPSWEGFDEARVADFFQKVQEISNNYHLMEKWCEYNSRNMILSDDEYLEMLYTLDLLKKTYQAKKRAPVRYTKSDYPMLEVTVKIWRNSTHENGARCFFQLQHEAKMTAYQP